MTTKHTYDMGVIGNCAFLALVKQDTSISWLCWPRFDSSFVFGSLLDQRKGGEFSIKPATKDATGSRILPPDFRSTTATTSP
jgi:GH15 family glucan-1,4-alpha-glucosidase